MRVGRLSRLRPGGALDCRRCRTRMRRDGGFLRVQPYVTVVAPLVGESVALVALCVECVHDATPVERLAAYHDYWLDSAPPGRGRDNEMVWLAVERAVAAGAA